MTARYAIYYAPPPDHPLWRLGSSWLGRDAATGMVLDRPDCGLDPGLMAALTRDPAHYGFHATLKPPFVLAAGTDIDGLRAALAALAGAHRRFDAPPVRPSVLGRFRALLLAADCLDMDRLAAACVRDLDRFRAPPAADELARRLAAGLTQGQALMLQRYGYPHVLGEFRFHMTLTGPLSGGMAEVASVDAALSRLFAPVHRAPLPVHDLCLFHQPDRDTAFRLVERFPLAP